MSDDKIIPFDRKYIRTKDNSFTEAADIIEGTVLTCECGCQSFTLYVTGDVQCTECEEFVNILCYLEED